MLAALNIGALVLGAGTGALTSALATLVLSTILNLAGMDDGANVGLVLGIVIGLAAGGWVAGSRAIHSERFHGMVTGLLLAFLVVIIAKLGGSQPSSSVVVWLAVVCISTSGLSGWLAGRRKKSQG